MKRFFTFLGVIAALLMISGCKDKVESSSTTPYYPVTFVTNANDVTVDPQSILEGMLATKPTDPERQGYTFENWYTDNNTFNELYTFTTPVVSELTLYAKWTEKAPVLDKFNITFETNGGEPISPTSVNKGDKLAKPTTPTRPNYKFIGWYTDTSLNTAFDFTTAITNEFTLYAKWEEDIPVPGTYRVTFNTLGGSDIAYQDVVEGDKATTPSEPTKLNSTFLGWFTDENCTQSFSFNTAIVRNITLYAGWDILSSDNKFTIEFNTSMDSIVNSQVITSGNKVKQPQIPIKTNYDFTGWYTDVECNNKYDFNTPVISSFVLYAGWERKAVAETYTVSFNSNGGSLVASQIINHNMLASKPINPIKDGKIFTEWYSDAALTITFDFKNTLITTDTVLYAKWRDKTSLVPGIEDVGAYNESIYAVWEDNNPESSEVYYQAMTETSWTKVDRELIREIGNGFARVDVVGIKADIYRLKVVTSSNDSLIVEDIYVESHDRSGYAHFNYNEGVGAYKDDGTLKDNAKIIYVTNENRNLITLDGIYQAKPGLGYLLNNAQYSKSGSNTYTSESSKSLSSLTVPLVIRLLGTVTSSDGLTAYNSIDNGGTVGDNGHMARMKDCMNITIEGIGEDAVVYGWGIHFMSATKGKGVGFEVRNLTFDKYPEDALGMEGVQTSGVLTAPVERCWVHHNTFNPGFCANPAQGDKKQGDGSCDFKRGQYYTLSYNFFNGAHKTNLVGGKDEHLQYHITMHHNYWQDCSSRMPLSRKGNVHMYNNFFETTDNCSNEVSYVQNTRANAYIFSEANYFQASKNPCDVRSGAIKSYGDIKYSCYEDDGSTQVTNRTTPVSSGNIYENFDTNSSIFYYDSENKVSNVERLTDAATAKAECKAYSGVYKKSEATLDSAKIYLNEPTVLNDDRIVTTSNKISKGIPLLIFTIHTDAVFTMSSTGSVVAVLVDIYGKNYLSGTGSVEITAGTYVIESARARGASKGTSQAKEATVDSYSIIFDNGAASAARIAAAKAAIKALPDTITYSNSNKKLIQTARSAYNALKGDEAIGIDESRLLIAEATYVEQGRLFIEEKINAIGVVSEDSLSLISAARTAYNEASHDIKNRVTNYAVLTKAEDDFQQFAVDSLNKTIAALTDYASAATDRDNLEDLLVQYQEAYDLYDSLDEDKKASITNFAKVQNGIQHLNGLLSTYEFTDLIAEVDLTNITLENAAGLVSANKLFEKFNAQQKALVSEAIITKYEAAWEIYTELASRAITHNFTKDGLGSEFFTFTGCKTSDGKGSIMVNDENLTLCLKMESATTITFTTVTQMTLKLYFNANAKAKIDGTSHSSDASGVLTITLEAGTHTIQKETVSFLFYIALQ